MGKSIIHDFFVFILGRGQESAAEKNNGKIKCWKSLHRKATHFFIRCAIVLGRDF
jgi:hypothetical protein